MPTVIFDFDSTVITCESLEKLLEASLESRTDLQSEVLAITEAGIQGKIPFLESLKQRLQIAAPTKQDVLEFGEQAYQWITPGMENLIQDLHSQNISVWIASGAPRELIIPLGKRLGIVESQIQAVQFLWGKDGSFKGIDPLDPFSKSKAEGIRSLSKVWDTPIIAVGDGASDYAMLKQKLVDYFILFTQYIRYEGILEQGIPEAQNCAELRKQLTEIIQFHAG